MRTLRLAAIAAFCLACGSSSPSTPPVKDPPQVFLLVPNSNVIGSELDVQVTVEGCDKVTSASVTSDDGAINKAVTYDVASGNPVPVAIGISDVAHWKSIADHLALSASATCDDGRKNTSQAQPATFFPAAQVFSHADGSYVVPTSFYAEGSGASTTFIGCGANSDGTSALVRVDTSGAIIANQTLPSAMACDFNSSITDPVTDSGGRKIRWIITPATNGETHPGAVAFLDDNSLTFTGQAVDENAAIPAIWYLAVAPTGEAGAGDAVVLAPNNTGLNWVYRIDHLNLLSGHTNPSTGGPGGPVWMQGAGVPPAGDSRLPMGNPVISSNNVWIPVRELDEGNKQAYFDVEQRYFDPSGSASGGDWVTYPPTVVLGPENYADLAPSIAMTISADGSLTYLPFNTYDASGNWTGGFSALACASTANCNTSTYFNDPLAGSALAAVPFGSGFPYVAAVADQHTYFIGNNATNKGTVISNVDPTGALVTSQVQPGKGQDFYVLNAAGVGQWPLEVVAIDTPANGELFRYTMTSNSLSVALDDSGQPWLRIGPELVQLLPLSQYRSMLNQ